MRLRAASMVGVVHTAAPEGPNCSCPAALRPCAAASPVACHCQSSAPLLEYGDPQGFLPLREQLRLKLAELGISASPAQILTTSGVTQALDLIAQAEHSPGVAILVTWYEPLIEEVYNALQKRLAKLSRADLARDSLERYASGVLPRVQSTRS